MFIDKFGDRAQQRIESMLVIFKDKFSLQKLYQLLFAPSSTTDESRRREFMVNVILCGFAVVTGLKVIFAFINDLQLGLDQDEDSLLINGLFLVAVLIIWMINRRRHYQIAAYALLILMSLEALRVTLNWSFELPLAELMYASIIVAAGVILTARSALITSVIVSLSLLSISYEQIHGSLKPHIFWTQKDFQISDTFGYVSILLIIAIVSWLTSREVSSSLSRAHQSELELVNQRDNLEVILAARTEQLLETQKLRNQELEHFAEFGRSNAALLHEISNPLTAATLNLEAFEGKNCTAIRQARSSLHQLDRYISAARKQLKTHGLIEEFDVNLELKMLLLIMVPLANRKQIAIEVRTKANLKLYGDAIKFSQIITNLIANAIDAYDVISNPRLKRVITLNLRKSSEKLYIKISDNGEGINSEIVNHIFDSFFTTKSTSERGSGIGLMMVKRAVEKDFQGTVSVVSKLGVGTSFFVKLSNGL